MNDWHIQSRAHACQACGRHFADKQPYHTLLSDHKSELLRQDICVDCWAAQHSHGSQDRKGFVSHWQGVYETPPAAPPDAIQKETAETLLRKLVELNDPKYTPSTFVLAVMLERKRLLKVKEQLKRDGQRIIIYEHAKNGDLFTIADPNLQLNHIEQVQHDVAQLLEHGLPEVPPVPAPTPAADALPEAAPSPETVPSEPAAIDPAVPSPASEPVASETPAATSSEIPASVVETPSVLEVLTEVVVEQPAEPVLAPEPVPEASVSVPVEPQIAESNTPVASDAAAATPEPSAPVPNRRGKRRAQP
ncbi:MAG: hypothetical protein WCO56_17600 [Verrucomicrobiota bacterium]